MKSLFLSLLLPLLGAEASTAAVIQNSVLVGNGVVPLGGAGVATERGSFGYTPLSTTTFQVAGVTLAWGVAYFIVAENDPLTRYDLNIADALASNTGLAAGGQQFTIPDGGSILLGFWEDADESGFAPGLPKNYLTSGDNYGWVRITNNGGTLSSLGSAVADDGPGILAGTLTAIPEPAVAITGLLGILPLLRRRRR